MPYAQMLFNNTNFRFKVPEPPLCIKRMQKCDFLMSEEVKTRLDNMQSHLGLGSRGSLIEVLLGCVLFQGTVTQLN